MKELMAELMLIASSISGQYDLPMPTSIMWSNDPQLEGYQMNAYGRTLCRVHNRENVCLIIIHHCVVDVDKRFAKQVITHEMAHYVDFATSGKADGHSKLWARIMRERGFSANVTAPFKKACSKHLKPKRA